MSDREVTLTVKADTIQAALNTLDACTDNPREPDRYRAWYAEAAAELRLALRKRHDSR